MRPFALLTVATIALCACQTGPSQAPARIAEHHPTGAETAERGTAMQVTLDKVSNPEGRLAHSNVQDKNGEKVGTVRKVIVDSTRNPIALQVDVGAFLGMGGKVVEIKAADLRYEQDRNILTTTLRKPQIQALPEIKG
jgi:hypothetical protein